MFFFFQFIHLCLFCLFVFSTHIVNYDFAGKVQTPLVFGDIVVGLTNQRLLISKTDRTEQVELQKETTNEFWTSAYRVNYKINHGSYFYSVNKTKREKERERNTQTHKNTNTQTHRSQFVI